METRDEVAGDVVQRAMAVLGSLPAPESPEACIDRLQLVEQAARMLRGDQALTTSRFVDYRHADEAALRIPTSQRCKGIEAEVGFARGESPYVGAALTHTATALCTVLPHTLAALTEGRVSEFHARVVAQETLHLSDAHRRAIDALIAHRLGKASTTQLRRLIQGHAYRLDRAAAEARAAENTSRRRVCKDPAGDGLVYVTAELPSHQGAAVMETLTRLTNQRLDQGQAVDADGTPLTRDQVMTDLFVELLTGQTTANGVQAEVIVVMHDTTLFGADDLPAWLPGDGPVPAGMITDWLADPAANIFLRRLYTRPTDGQLVAMDSRRRHFPKNLTKMLKIRDDVCATPWCNSPVQDADHRHPWAEGGPTSWENATGLCKRCNQRKENRGWTYTGTVDELTVTTPTGHTYTVDTRPPLAELKHWNSDPPAPLGAIDIAWADAA
ncbi:HNH endonuclease [Enteractinococcus coprophilus]|uniref:HNH endonuclease n=1 Tax=Enteractinococcus coprophilus TaxID=1027633 RepID=UPI00114F02C1|nr:DUF222 domain-containing protein [Enteractinococcus coprophilus]